MEVNGSQWKSMEVNGSQRKATIADSSGGVKTAVRSMSPGIRSRFAKLQFIGDHIQVLRVSTGRWEVFVLFYSYCMHSNWSMTGPNIPSASGRAA